MIRKLLNRLSTKIFGPFVDNEAAIQSVLLSMGKDCAHEWEVYSTASAVPCLELNCRRCGLLGVVSNPTQEEWERAFDAPSNPYPWLEPDRVETTYASVGEMISRTRRTGNYGD
jgi:hypothetical protein